jgi:hypothetical protein
MARLLGNPDLMLGMDGGYAEIFQYGKEFGILLVLLFGFLKNRTLILLGWQTLFVYLLLDDALRLHERLGKSLAAFLHLSPLAGLRARDVGELLISACVGSLIIGLLSLGYCYASSRLRKMSQHLMWPRARFFLSFCLPVFSRFLPFPLYPLYIPSVLNRGFRRCGCTTP